MSSRIPRLIGLLTIAVLLVAVFGGCKGAPAAAPSTEAAQTTAETAAATETSAPGEKITLRLMMFPDNPADDEMYVKLIEEYQSAHPNIKIEKETVPWNVFEEKLMPQVVAGNPPDIARISSQWGSKYAEMGALADLSEFIKKEDIEKFYPGRWVTCVYNEKPFGLPETSIAIAMWYNKTLVDKAGVQLPTSVQDEWTWEEFKQAAAEVQKKAGAEYGFAVYKSFFPYLAWIYSGGGTLLKEDLKTPAINEAKSVDAIDFLAGMHKEGIAPVSVAASGDPDAGQKIFQAGKVAFYYSGVWLTATFAESIKDFEFAATYLPRRAGEDPATNASGENLIIFNNCKHKKEAFEFISWFTNKENTERHLAAAALLSPRVDASPQYQVRPDVMKVFGEQAAVLKTQWALETHIPQFSKIVPTFMDQMTLALTGKASAQDAANAVAEEINKIMQE